MPAQKFAAALESHLAPVVRSTDGTVGLGSFLSGVAAWLKLQGHNAVDTEAERDALLAGVMLVADRLVAPRLGGLWVIIRPVINEFLDDQMDILPTLV